MNIFSGYTIAQVFKRPAMYIGRPFQTLREFHIFVMTLGVVRDDGLPEEESLAVKSLSCFVVTHFYGSFENRSWEEELLRVSEDEDSAIFAAMIIVLELAAMIRSRGAEKLDESREGAADFDLIPSPLRWKRLEELIGDP